MKHAHHFVRSLFWSLDSDHAAGMERPTVSRPMPDSVDVAQHHWKVPERLQTATIE